MARRIKADIDEFCRTHYDDGFRKHLGASLIGRDCDRELWYGFRWIFKAPLSGRQYRLFDRGHKEEPRFLHWLRGIGCEVWEFNPDANGDTKGENQFRIYGVEGHFGGSLDSIIKLPERYGPIGFAFLGEFKTSGTGRKFTDLTTKRVKVVKPEHYTQMCVYGKHYGFKYALYMAINKNDDDLHIEVVDLDWREAEKAEIKAARIIWAAEAPPKISQSPNYEKCMICDYKPVCHGTDPGVINCRSCKHAAPIQGKQWHCALHNDTIPPEFIADGCGAWVTILK